MFLTRLIGLWFWIGGGASLFHDKSMKTITAPNDLPDDSYFGFSMTITKTSLIISAPNADRFGKIFSCELSLKSCKEITFLSTKEIRQAKEDEMKYKFHGHHHWLGASLKTTKTGFVACAPRWLREAKDLKYSYYENTGMFGRCYNVFSYESGLNSSELHKLTSKDRHRFCGSDKELCSIRKVADTFGWTTDVKENSLAVGGSGLSSGQVMFYNDIYSAFAPVLFKYEVIKAEEIKRNFGESVAFGNFLQQDRQNNNFIYAVSSTYENGKILVLNETVLLLSVRDGGQVGSRYGAFLSAVNFGDTTDKLLVGAPFFAPDDVKLPDYDIGAVHILDPFHPYKVKKGIVYGTRNGAMFGSAIVDVGDVDGDNINDVAISAPFEGRTGAVYIYSGASLEKGGAYIQKISPSERDSEGFGLSLLTLQNEGKKCKDLIVGSPLSNRVHFIKCSTATVFKVYTEGLPLQNRTSIDNFTFNICISANYVDKTTKTVKKDFKVLVRLSHEFARIFEKGVETNEITYLHKFNGKNPKSCKTITVNTPTFGHYEQDILYQISVSPSQSSPSEVTVSHLSHLTIDNPISAADCKNSSTGCKPIVDVRLKHYMNDTYLMGSTKSENFTISVKNIGDGAVYGACIQIDTYGVRIRTEGVRGYGVCCYSISTTRSQCKRLESMQPGETWNLDSGLFIETDDLTSEDKEIEVKVKVFSHFCEDQSTSLDRKETRISLLADKFNVTGASSPSSDVNITKHDIENTDTYLRHVYMITNDGQTNWKNFKCNIILENKDYLQYSKVLFTNLDPNKRQQCYKHSNLSSTIFSCQIGELSCNNKGRAYIYVYIDALHGSDLDSAILLKNASITSQLDVILKSQVISSTKVTTTLYLQKASVPLWIIIVSSIVGLIILVIIYYILKQLGFMRRKDQEKLTSLKKDVHRQSVRRKSCKREEPEATSKPGTPSGPSKTTGGRVEKPKDPPACFIRVRPSVRDP